MSEVYRRVYHMRRGKKIYATDWRPTAGAQVGELAADAVNSLESVRKTMVVIDSTKHASVLMVDDISAVEIEVQ